MNARANRTSLALVLVIAAITVPCVAWYIVGWREASHRAREIEEAPQRLARETAARLAERLRDRLETLLENESKRPFYHYQNFYHDPRGAYEGAAVVPSPLAQGPIDPLIRTYFQLDAAGRFTLPQLITEPTDTPNQSDAELAELVAVRKQLELQMPTYITIVREEVRQEKEQAVQQSSSSAQTSQRPSLQRRVEVLDSQAWAQNLAANEVYSALRNPGKATSKAQDSLEKIRANTGNVAISVGPLKWFTSRFDHGLSLVALRDVQTPYGRVLQGFLISAAGLADALKTSPFPTQLLPARPPRAIAAPVRLGDGDWFVVVDANLNLEDAMAQARAVRVSFLRAFAWGVATAGIAGLSVVGLVWQTERLARQRAQFAASAAHELRTPLAGLRMYAEMLAEGLGDPAKYKDYARHLMDEAERLGRVVANVLGFTRLERGTLQVRPVPGDLTGAIHECVARQLPALESAGVTVTMKLPDAMPQVKFDRDALAQILQNLLDNAEKHTRESASRVVEVTIEQGNGTVALSVADRGPGVPVAVRSRLFRPFQRGNGTDGPAGMGLGLVLVRGLARAHGGDVAYRDNPGGGAKFVVNLPVS
jgi:signal transduction histidine kinase